MEGDLNGINGFTLVTSARRAAARRLRACTRPLPCRIPAHLPRVAPGGISRLARAAGPAEGRLSPLLVRCQGDAIFLAMVWAEEASFVWDLGGSGLRDFDRGRF